MRWLREVIIDGLLLAIPLVVLGLLLGHVIELLRKALAPVAALAPQGRIVGIALVDLLAIAALLVGLVLVGLFARSNVGRRTAHAIEQLVLRKIPGFLLFRAIAAGFSSTEKEAGFKPALIEFDDHAELGFIVEDNQTAENVVVFLPSAPTPAAGSVVVVPRARIRLLDMPAGAAIKSITGLGLGLQAFVQMHSIEQRSST